MDLSEALGEANRLDGGDTRVKAKLDEIRGYAGSSGVPVEALVKMAKLGIVLDDWMVKYDIQATALQCWSSLQQELWRELLHFDEHDEREADAQRLRGGRGRHGGDVRPAARLRNAQRACGLE
jgi:hypothetical protein